MGNEGEEKQYRRELFIKLLLMLRAGTLQNLGMLTNPITGKKEVKLELAKETIDMLELLREKTSGNLTEPEQEMLDNLLTELMLLYVKIRDKGEQQSKEEV